MGERLTEKSNDSRTRMPPRAVMVAAPASGVGKTTLVLALLAALRARGIAVRAAKTGPDYIDPGLHRAAGGHDSFNLDSWAMPPALLAALFEKAGHGAEFLVVEAAMGLFDGAPLAPAAGQPAGSAAEIAVAFGLPVLLVLDVRGQAQSAAAVALGFARYRPELRLAGVVLNRVGSAKHRQMIADSLAALGIPLLGALPRLPELALPERHLGLVQAAEQTDWPARLAAFAQAAEAYLDLDAVLAATEERAPELQLPAPASPAAALPPPGQRIALAADAAFSFVYPHMLAFWRAAGAEIYPFSPLADEAPPDFCDACWLGGGYPELHAAQLAAARRFRAGMQRFAETRPIHGECGGYMVLGQALEDAQGTAHAMLGLLGHCTSFAQRRLSLGYRRARLLADCALGRQGTVLRGHEFHYATIRAGGTDPPLAALTDAAGTELGLAGGRRGRVSGSFFHAIALEEFS
jgi:cobyrinic acid a,c-diamide synthase